MDEICSQKKMIIFLIYLIINSNILIKIDTAYLSKDDYLRSLNTNMIIKDNQIHDLNLLSKFPNNEEFKVSIKTNQTKKDYNGFKIMPIP